MLEAKIIDSWYNETDYPNADPDIYGIGIPKLWAPKTNISPHLIDQKTSKYKICDNQLASIDAVRSKGQTLTSGTHYSEDLTNGEFTFLSGAPFVEGGSTYYIMFYGDWTISTSNYIWVVGRTTSHYAGGTFYKINGAGTWSDQSEDLIFRVYGRRPGGSEEELIIDGYTSGGTPRSNTFRYDSNNTTYAQSITIPSGQDWYITRVRWYSRRFGTPSGDVWIEIHSDQVGTQVGGDSETLDATTINSGGTVAIDDNDWDLFNAADIRVDATGQYSDLDDVIDDLLQNSAGMASGDIDTAALAALGTALTEDQGIFVQDDDATVLDTLLTLESGLLFKHHEDADGKITFTQFSSGEPAGTPHLKDADIISFKTIIDPTEIIKTINFFYDEDPTEGTWSLYQATSTTAQYLYKSKKELDIYTYHVSEANADGYGDDMSEINEVPKRSIEVTTREKDMLDRIPTNKVKITQERAPGFSGGTLSGVLFRIFEIEKQPNGLVRFTAQLDSQTYAA
jgi:hypothetical protein